MQVCDSELLKLQSLWGRNQWIRGQMWAQEREWRGRWRKVEMTPLTPRSKYKTIRHVEFVFEESGETKSSS